MKKFLFSCLFILPVLFLSFIPPISATSLNTKKSNFNLPNPSVRYSNILEKFQKNTSKVSTSRDIPYVEDEIIVKYNSNVIKSISISVGKEEQNFLKKYGLERKKRINSDNLVVVSIKDFKQVEEKIKELEKDPNIEYVQPNYIYHQTSIATNDPYKTSLWGLDNYGQVVDGFSGLADKDIDAPEAWEVLKRNDNEVIIAVIDNGIDYIMDDLWEHMWDGSDCVNELNVPISGGCTHGYDYDDEDSDPYPDLGDTHGSHIAGTIAAVGNNGMGIVGVSPNVKIMALKTSSLTTASIVSAIGFAKYNGAQIINASWAGTYYDVSIKNAITDFPGLFVTAAANDSDNHDSGETIHKYPCDYSDTNIVCVAATNSRDELAYFSDYGLISVDLGAPGQSILSTVTDPREFEYFDNYYNISIPTNWSRDGYNNEWGVAPDWFDDQGKFLCTDYWACAYNYYSYENWANSLVVSETYSMAKSELAFFYMNLFCDTEYTPNYWSDYLSLEVSGDGYNYSELKRWDESDIDDDSNPSGVAFSDELVDIPVEFFTNNFRFRFRWVTNGSDNFHFGCGVDNLMLFREGYDFKEGTSMASPHVAGVAGMVWGYRPNLTTEQVKEAIVNTGDLATSLSGKTVSGKRVNAYSALLSVQGDVIQDFKLQDGGTQYPCSISEKYKTLSCNIPSDVDKTNNTPIINLTGGAILPASGTANNFLENNTYTFTKSDLTEEIYTVNITNYFAASTQFRSGQGNWSVPNAKFVVSGDYDGNGRDEVGVMYDYGNSDMGLIVFSGDGTSLEASLWFRSGPRKWSVPNAKFLTSEDFDNDGKDEIGVMYDYGNKDMALLVFDGNAGVFEASTWFRSGPGNWSVPNAKFSSASDFNGDGKGDIGVMYDYGNSDMGLIVFASSGSQFIGSLWFRSGVGNWSVPNAKFASSADYDGDGFGDIGIMYDYGNSDMGLIVFKSNGSILSGSLWFRSGIGKWSVPNAKFFSSSDYNWDGFDDISIIYDYGNSDMGLIVFGSNGSILSGSLWFRSGVGNWSVPNAKFFSSGDYNGNGNSESLVMYDYGNSDMSLIVFR